MSQSRKRLSGRINGTYIGGQQVSAREPKGTIQAVVFFQPQKLMEMGWQWWPSNAILGNNTYSYSIIHYTFFRQLDSMGATLFALRSNWNSLPPVWVRGAILETPKQYLAVWTSTKTRVVSARSSILVHGLQPSFRWQELKEQQPENGKPKPCFLEILEGISSKFFKGLRSMIIYHQCLQRSKHVFLLGQTQGVLKFPWLVVDEQEGTRCCSLCITPPRGFG